MELYLIRHAQSQNNARHDAIRSADPPLTDLGREQATCLAEWLPSVNLTRLVTSPFLRTLETTHRIQAATGLTPEVRIQLHEQGGCYSGHISSARIGQPGMTRKEIEQQFPGFKVEAELDGEGWWRRKRYETRDQAKQRAGELLQRTRDEFASTSERVAFMMHADIKVLLLEHFHSDPLDVPCNASVTRVLITPQEIRLEEYNRIDHLPRSLITF